MFKCLCKGFDLAPGRQQAVGLEFLLSQYSYHCRLAACSVELISSICKHRRDQIANTFNYNSLKTLTNVICNRHARRTESRLC